MSSIMTRQERERFVLELYNRGKNIREIAKEARMSFRIDIGIILNKEGKEKKTEGMKEEEEQDNIDSEKNQNQNHQQRLSLSAHAYKLFSEGKTPIQVAIALNLRENQTLLDSTKNIGS